MKTSMLFVAGLVSATTLFAEEVTLNNWRVRVGGGMRFGIESSMHYRSGMIRPPASGNNAVEALQKITDYSATGRAEFDNGFFDSNGADPSGGTTHWRTTNLDSVFENQVTFTSSYVGSGDVEMRDVTMTDKENTPQVTLSLVRNIWQNERWGVDLSAGLSWFQNVTLFKNTMKCGGISSGTYSMTALTAIDGGTDTRPAIPLALYDDLGKCWGAGDDYESVPGPILDVNTFNLANLQHVMNAASPMWLNTKGEMNMLELQLALEPFVRVTDNFYLRGKVGAAMIYTDVSIDTSIRQSSGNLVYNETSDQRDIRFCGVVGASAEYYFTQNFFAQAGVEMLIGNPKTDIDTPLVSGKVSPGDFGFTVSLGYSF